MRALVRVKRVTQLSLFGYFNFSEFRAKRDGVVTGSANVDSLNPPIEDWGQTRLFVDRINEKIEILDWLWYV